MKYTFLILFSSMLLAACSIGVDLEPDENQTSVKENKEFKADTLGESILVTDYNVNK